MHIITKPLPKPPAATLDLIHAAQTASRQMQQRIATCTLTAEEGQRMMKRIDAALAASMTAIAASPPPERPFRVIDGGRS